MKNHNMGGVEILTARLRALWVKFNNLKTGKAVETATVSTAQQAISDFKAALKIVQPFLDKILAIAKNKSGELSAEETNSAKAVFTAAPIFTTVIAKVEVSESLKVVVSQLTMIAKAVDYVATNMGATAQTLAILNISSFDIESLKKTKAKIDANKNLQTFHPTPEDIVLLERAKAECQRFINHYFNEPNTAENQKNLELAAKMLKDYNALSQNFDNCQSISPATEEALGLAVDMAIKNRPDNKKLTKVEEALVSNFRENLQSLANAQQNGFFPQHEIRENLTEDEMERASGIRTAIAVMKLEEGVPVICIAKKCKNPKATLVHETQHVIQYQKGELAFVGNNPFLWVYDIYDEVDAHKMQYLAVPTSLKKPIQSIDEITPEYLSDTYGHLPKARLSLTSTFQEIENALAAANLNENLPSHFFNELRKPGADAEKEPAIIINWDDIKNMPLKDFLSSKDEKHIAAVKLLGQLYYCP